MIKLCDPEHAGDDFRAIGLAEGIEDALAVIGRFGWEPVWATAIIAGNMRTFPAPARSCRGAVWIFHDDDQPDRHGRRAGNDAAEAVRDRCSRPARGDGVLAAVEAGPENRLRRRSPMQGQ